METNGDPQTPAAMTPPTELGDAPECRSGWPTMIGIIAVVFGVLGVLGGCSGLVFNVFAAIWGSSMQWMPEVQKAQFEVMRQYVVPTSISMVVATVVAAWLLVAGIGVLRRRPWSRGATVGWAVAKIIYAIPAYFLNKAQFEAMEQAAIDSGTPMPTGRIFTIMQSVVVPMMGCSMLWTWALPLFLIIWFRRASVKTEVERWALPLGLPDDS